MNFCFISHQTKKVVHILILFLITLSHWNRNKVLFHIIIKLNLHIFLNFLEHISRAQLYSSTAQITVVLLHVASCTLFVMMSFTLQRVTVDKSASTINKIQITNNFRQIVSKHVELAKIT